MRMCCYMLFYYVISYRYKKYEYIKYLELILNYEYFLFPIIQGHYVSFVLADNGVNKGQWLR